MQNQKKRIKRAFIIPAIMLIVPVIDMLTVEGWNWSWHDFLFAYTIWTVFGLIYVGLTKNALTTQRKIVTGFLVFGILAAIWVTLATG